jgi:uncharacterized coiled-coil protein SlyX
MKKYEHKIVKLKPSIMGNWESAEEKIDKLSENGWEPHLMTEKTSVIILLLRRIKDNNEQRNANVDEESPPPLP